MAYISAGLLRTRRWSLQRQKYKYFRAYPETYEITFPDALYEVVNNHHIYTYIPSGSIQISGVATVT